MGFAWIKDGLAHYTKGFMTVETALAEYERIKSFLTKEDKLVIHWRIGTHGAKDQTMTHPFPASSNPEDLKALSGSWATLLIHNGVMSNMPTDKDLSDTAVLARDYLAPMVNSNLPRETRNAILNQLKTSSRLCVMDGDGEVVLMGSWEEDKATKLMYSNMLWKPTPVTTYNRGHQHFDYGDDYSEGWGYGRGGYHAPNAATKTQEKKAAKEARKAARLLSDDVFDSYVLSPKEKERLFPVNHPVYMNRIKIDPKQKNFEDLFVLDGDRVFQLFDSEKSEYLYLGRLDYFGEAFPSATAFLEHMKKHNLLGVTA